MLVEIKRDIFDTVSLRSLNHLIGILTYDDRYDLFVELLDLENSNNYKQLSMHDKEFLNDLYNGFAQSSRNADWFISETNQSEKSLTLEEANIYFYQPLLIILENSLNDSYFLNALIDNLDNDESKKIFKHIDHRWILFDNAGGATNIQNNIKGIKNSFRSLAQKTGRDATFYLRVFVLLDSDKKYSTAALSPEKIKLTDFLCDYKISFHILEKREMENYIPDEVLEEFESQDKFIELYLKLTDEQKDYFDLNEGFSKSRSDRNYDLNVLNLFATVTDQDWRILKNGINLEPYKKNFKSEFPKLFEHEKVTKETLLNRTKHQKNPNELQEILDKIRRLL